MLHLIELALYNPPFNTHFNHNEIKQLRTLPNQAAQQKRKDTFFFSFLFFPVGFIYCRPIAVTAL